MRSWPERRKRQARIEIIPMIDVMMFLLVFFVLISLNVLPARGLHVALPGARAPERLDEPRKVTISIAAGGDLALDGAAITLAALPDRLAALHRAEPGLNVIIAGDHAADLQHIVDVLDALKLAGIATAAIVTKPPP